MRAICIHMPHEDYKFRGVRNVPDGMPIGIAIEGAIRKWYDGDVDESVIAAEVHNAENFFVDPAVADRLRAIEVPAVGSDSANDAIGETLIAVCRAFEVSPCG